MSEHNPSPEELLARTIRHYRDERLRMTAQELADRVGELGGTLSRQAISKIETGGRKVSVDELMILARALGVAPLLLLFPVGTETERINGTVECIPGEVLDFWSAAQWFSGEVDRRDSRNVPLYLFRKHARQVGDYESLIAQRELAKAGLLTQDDVLDDPTGAKLRARSSILLRDLRNTRAEMERHGLQPPLLPPDLKHVDDRKYVYRNHSGLSILSDEVTGRPIDFSPTADDPDSDQ